MKNELYRYDFKLTTLSPVHIGTGEVYDPSNFTIDEKKFFEFDEISFYQNLDEKEKRDFNSKLHNWMDIIDFYRSKKRVAKKIAKFECSVSEKVENAYQSLYNKNGSKNQNQFQIAKTFKNPNTHKAIIPGSSIKGMFDTVFKIYPNKVDNAIRQQLIVADAVLHDGKTEIGYCYRKHKNPERQAKSDIPQIVEIVSKGSTFHLTVRTSYTFHEMRKKFENYHNERKSLRNLKDANAFIARVGKFSGKAYMVDDGKNVLNNDGKPVATHTLYEDGSQFGWVKFEVLNLEKQSVSIPDTLLGYRKRLVSSIEKRGIKRNYYKNRLHKALETDEGTIGTLIETLNIEVEANGSIEPFGVLTLLDKVIENQYQLMFADRVAMECDCTMDALLSFAEDENIDIENKESIVSVEIFEDIRKYIPEFKSKVCFLL